MWANCATQINPYFVLPFSDFRPSGVFRLPETWGWTRLGPFRHRSSSSCQTTHRLPKQQWRSTSPTTATTPRTRGSSPLASSSPWGFQWLWGFLWWLEPPASSCFTSIATSPFSTSCAAWLGIRQQINNLLKTLPSQNPEPQKPWITY